MPGNQHWVWSPKNTEAMISENQKVAFVNQCYMNVEVHCCKASIVH